MMAMSMNRWVSFLIHLILVQTMTVNTLINPSAPGTQRKEHTTLRYKVASADKFLTDAIKSSLTIDLRPRSSSSIFVC